MNKTEYLAARADQKQAYHRLSDEIRGERKIFREAQKAFSRAQHTQRAGTSGWSAELSKAWSALSDSRYHMNKLKSQATKMIQEVHDLKEETHEAWLAKKETAMS